MNPNKTPLKKITAVLAAVATAGVTALAGLGFYHYRQQNGADAKIRNAIETLHNNARAPDDPVLVVLDYRLLDRLTGKGESAEMTAIARQIRDRSGLEIDQAALEKDPAWIQDRKTYISAREAFARVIPSKTATGPDICLVGGTGALEMDHRVMERFFSELSPDLANLSLRGRVAHGSLLALTLGHEAAHCRESARDADGAALAGWRLLADIHRRETAADLAGVAQMVRSGFDLETARLWRDYRTLAAFYAGPARAQEHESGDPRHFSGVVYYTAPALDALIGRISDGGLDAFRALPQEKVDRLVATVAAEKSLTRSEMAVLHAVVTRGRADGEDPEKEDFTAALTQSFRDDVLRARVNVAGAAEPPAPKTPAPPKKKAAPAA